MAAIAAGLSPTLANVAYSPRELAHQYHNSGAKLIFTYEEGFPKVKQMFEEQGVADWENRVVIVGKGLKWAGGPDMPREHENLPYLQDMLAGPALEEEEKFDGQDAHETALLCYSSVSRFQSV